MSSPAQADHTNKISGNTINVSVQHLVAEYLDCKQTFEIYCKRVDGTADSEQGQICEQVRLKLDEIYTALNPSKGRSKNIFLAWRLIHRVGEDLILLMTPEELYAQGNKILHDLKTSPLPDIIKLDWLSKVEACVTSLESICKQPAPPNNNQPAHVNAPSRELRCSAQLFRTVTNNINDFVDDRFWDIWSRKFITMLYAGCLAAGLILLLAGFYYSGHAALGFWNILIIGAIGGVSSGILSAEQDFLAKGHFWVSVISYPLQRIVQGAVAALIMFAMIQSGYGIKINSPIDEQKPVPLVFGCYSGKSLHLYKPLRQDHLSSPNGFVATCTPQNAQPPSVATKATAQASTVAQSNNSNTNKPENLTFFALNPPPDKQFFLYLIILFLAGFTGDKLLKYISDKVTARLFNEAEKTRDGK